MATHTLTDMERPLHTIVKKQKITNLTHKDIVDNPKVVGPRNTVVEIKNEDLETFITHHNIVLNVQNTPDNNSHRRMDIVKQAPGKATTIDLVGGIFCHICKLTYSNKREFDDHYTKHGGGDKYVYTCVVCYKEFVSYPSFRGHCYTHHVIKDRHKCEFCNKNFSKLTALRDHIKVFHNFKCTTCNKQFTSKNELVVHETIHNTSNAPPYHCQTCEVELATLESCKSHADDHIVVIYTCPICSENISSQDNASDHLAKHFNNLEEKQSLAVIQNSENNETSVELLGGIGCGYCSVVSKNRIEFDAHFSYQHGDKDIEYICIVCHKSFEKYSVFADHAYNHCTKDRFCCGICQKPFSRLSMLSTHIAACKADSDYSGKPFVCPKCGHRYGIERRLRTHLLDEHGIRCLTCPAKNCQKTFGTPKELLLHQQVHSSHHNWCRQCGLLLPSLASCSAHIDVHTRKLFGCPVCNKSFRERYSLQNHLAEHFTSVLRICKVCGKVYSNRRNFTYHLKTHTEKKIHCCSYCGKGFPKLERLQQHLNTHTGSKPYRCNICSRNFASYPNWVTHKRRMHNLEEKLINKKHPISEDDNFDCPEGVEEDCTQNDEKYSDSQTHDQVEDLAVVTSQINESSVKPNYVYQLQECSKESPIIDSFNEIQESVLQAETKDHDQVDDSLMEAESIIHIDIEKELQILENIPGDQNDKIELLDVLETDVTIFDNAGTEAPPNMDTSEGSNFPPEYGPEFTVLDSYGLDDHMLPHIDPLLTIKTQEFDPNNFQVPDFDAGMYQVAPKWEPTIFTKVCPEYTYGYGDMVDSNRLPIMNTDIF